MNRNKVVGLVLAGMMAASASVLADVTWMPAHGGMVGKGDVQAAFGWNNATMQNHHTSISFEYDVTAGYTFECEWWTGPDHNRQHHTNAKEVTVGVQAAVTSESRRTGQYTGWYLDAIDAVEGDSVGEPTDADCGAEGNGMKSIVPGSVQPVSGFGGGLYAVFGGDRRLLQAF